MYIYIFFLKLCGLCMRAHVLSPSFRSKLKAILYFPKLALTRNECMHERSKSTHTLTGIYIRVAEIPKQSVRLVLNGNLIILLLV